MPKRRVVITGLGVLASNGIGKDAFFRALSEGTCGIKPISLFDTSEFEVKHAGEIGDFDPQAFLGAKGLRVLDRSIKLVTSAGKLALDDARLAVGEENSADIGVAIGSTLGSIQSISDYHKDALKEGVRYVNPALFPNTVINSPASQVSIKFNIKGFNATLSTGHSAGLDAIGYARDFLKLGRAKAVLAGGVEELCIQIFLAFYKTGCLSGPGNPALGEAAGILVLEDSQAALERKANIYAQVTGYGTGLDKTNGARKAICLAMEEAGLGSQDIDLILPSSNNRGREIEEVFGARAKDIPVSVISSLTGDCYSASGALQAIAATGVIVEGRAGNALINTADKSGRSSSLIISRFV